MSSYDGSRGSNADDSSESSSQRSENDSLPGPGQVDSNIDGDNDEASSQHPENEYLPDPEAIVDPDGDGDSEESSSQRRRNEPLLDPDEIVYSEIDGDNDESSEWADDRDQSPERIAYMHRRARPVPSPIRIAAPQTRAQLHQADYERTAQSRRIVQTYSPILTVEEYRFWFNRAHSEFLRRLRTQERFSLRRSIYLAALALYVSYDDFRVWNRLYGPVGAAFVSALAKKSIWKLQAEVLASVIDELQFQWRFEPEPIKEKAAVVDGMKFPSPTEQKGVPIPANQPQDKERKSTSSENPRPQSINRSPYAGSQVPGSGSSGGPQPDQRNIPEERPRSPMNQGNHYVPGRNIGRNVPIPPPKFSVPGLSFQKAVEDESTRIGTSGGIITAVAMAALALPNVSQTHWVARSCWTSSMVTALLAVYFSNDQAWTINHLSTEKKLRAWIMDVDPEDDYEEALRQRLMHPNGQPSTVILNSIAPAPSSAITISAPSLLLSSSLLLLLSGMGVFLAFVWTWEVDKDAGTASSRDVFIVYIVTLGVSLATVGFFSLGRVAVPIRQTIFKSIIGLQVDARKEGLTNRVDRKEVFLYRQLQSAYDTRELMQRQGVRLEERMEQLQQAVLSR